MLRIGLISYARSPRDKLPPARLRALLAEAALQGASLILLDGSTYSADGERILGETWTPDGWIRDWAAPPDVAVVVEGAYSDAQREVGQWIRRSCPVIADSGIDKLSFHALLLDSPLRRYAIPSLEIPDGRIGETLESAFREFRNAVVKPASGRNGVGIHFVHDQGDAWLVRHAGASRRGTLDAAVGGVASRIAGRLRYRSYLVQRYIRSVAGDGRAADIRAHVQRREDGEWALTRAYARLAEAGSPLANTSQGGYQGPLHGFLAERPRRSAADLQDETVSVALDVARLVDSTKSLPLAELGVDLAIDDDDRLWVIEANALPGTSLHEHPRAVHAIGYALAVARGVAGRERSLAADGAAASP